MAICKWMGWTIAELRATPDYYVPLIKEIMNEEAENVDKRD